MPNESVSKSDPAHGKTPPSINASVRELSRDPLRFFLTLTLEYGDVVQYRAAPEPAYLFNHPDYVKHILQTNARNYNKDTFLNKYQLESVVGQGLLTSENPLWRTQRRLMQPAFHQRQVAGFGEVMVAATTALFPEWDEAAAAGRPIDIAHEMMRLTLTIITQSLFGYDISAQADGVGEAINTMITVGRPRHRTFLEAADHLDRIVYSIINARRQAPLVDQGDLLSMLLLARYEDSNEGMDDRQVRDEVMSLLIAGHETTANTLSWLWYLLAQHPGTVERLCEEYRRVLGDRLPSAGDIRRLSDTHLVIQEGMRLYPSAWTISRRTLGDDVIGGYFIPAGSIVALSPYTMHRSPKYWENPERFDPDRFTPERSAGRPHFAYFPFGAGARQCIGNEFALMESMLIVPTILQRYRLQLVPDHVVEPHALVTLRPRNGILVTLDRR